MWRRLVGRVMRRARRAGAKTLPRRSVRALVGALALLLFVRTLHQPPPAATLLAREGGKGGDEAQQNVAARCVAWRATRCGSVLEERTPLDDLPCYVRINPRAKRFSGYCECAGQRVASNAVARACGETALIWHLRRAFTPVFTCAAACAASALAASPPLRLDASSRPWCNAAAEVSAADAAERALPQHTRTIPPPPPLTPAAAEALQALWRAVDDAFKAAGGLDVVLPPGARGFGATPHNDFVAAGARMPAADVATARTQWRAFLAAAPLYPAAALSDGAPLFTGRGIVIGGGGMRYMVPAWVALRALRRANCTLPVEIWFPAHEAPPPGSGLAAALGRLGAAVRSADEVLPGGSAQLFTRYTLKAVALLFSRFEEALWLDADNVAVRDPERFVFDAPPFRDDDGGGGDGDNEVTMLLWHDYWHASSAPDASLILGGVALPRRTCESGQLALRKRGAGWRAALLALFMNLQAPLYYRLLSSYMGAGDKETWPAAAAALGARAAWVDAPPGAAGAPARSGVLISNTMLQHAPGGGQLLVIHCNYFKWDLDVPSRATASPRRWLALTPAGWDAEEAAAAAERAGAPPPVLLPALPTFAADGLGDPEAAAWEDVRALRCAPWFEAYAHERRVRGGDLMSEHLEGGAPRSFPGLHLAEHAGGGYAPRTRWSWRPLGWVREAAR